MSVLESLRMLVDLEREQRKFDEEAGRHEEEKNRLDEEVKKLQHQLQRSADENTKKHLQDKISIIQAKREVAHSKQQKASALAWQRSFEQGGDVAQYYKKRAEESEDQVKKNEEHLKKLESEKKKREQYEVSKAESKSLLDEALKGGFVKVMILVCLIFGLPGAGKTHLQHLLLNKPPPHVRSSTICVEPPICINLRTGIRAQNLEGRWTEVGDKDMLFVVAEMIFLAEPELNQKTEQSRLSKITNFFLQRKEATATGAKPPTLTPPPKRKGTTTSSASLVSSVSDTCRKAIKKIFDRLISCMADIRGKFGGEGRLSQPSTAILSSNWLYFADSGGQPQYHELLPLFVRRISSALCVIRLTDKLDEVQVVELYNKGDRVGAPQLSQLTVKDTIQCLVNTIQSYSDQDQPPKIIMIGTHRDKLEEKLRNAKMTTASVEEASCQLPDEAQLCDDIETLEEKDKKLLEMLVPEFSNHLMFNKKKVLFPLNTLNPGEKDEAAAHSIRLAVEKSGAREVEIPIWWYIMEMLLQELARELGRGVLSKAECLEMAKLLGIREDSFNAALKFFNDLNVIKYLPDVLPDVVFIDSQIPLDKMSELVCHSYLLRQDSDEASAPIAGEWMHFRDHGIVRKEDLKVFPKHYVPDVFSQDDLSKLLKHLLVFAPVPRPDLTTIPAPNEEVEETHYVMPALMETLPDVDLEKHRVSSPEASPILIRFPHGSRRAGIFCCFVVHLIKYCGWKLIFDSKEPLYRNCIQLQLLTSPPCMITVIDSNSYIEVHVKITAAEVPLEKSAGLYPAIKETILSGISKACTALNYKTTKPEFSFFCAHPHSTSSAEKSKRHIVSLTADRQYGRCDSDPKISKLLDASQLIWFGVPLESHHMPPPRVHESTATASAAAASSYSKLSRPTSRSITFIEWRNERGEKKRFRLKELICHKWTEIGCLLEIPLPILRAWETKNLKDPLQCTNDVLSHWLENPTDYYPVSWEGLDRLLDNAELGQVAEELKQALSNAV